MANNRYSHARFAAKHFTITPPPGMGIVEWLERNRVGPAVTPAEATYTDGPLDAVPVVLIDGAQAIAIFSIYEWVALCGLRDPRERTIHWVPRSVVVDMFEPLGTGGA